MKKGVRRRREVRKGRGCEEGGGCRGVRMVETTSLTNMVCAGIPY